MVTIWICFCAFLNCAGWLLSALHALNRAGYAVAFAVVAVGWAVWRARAGAEILPRFDFAKIRRRFRRGFPRAFLILAGLAFLGGVLHPPTNFDGLAYRIPRTLHWLAEGQWHWIHTEFPRMNTRTCGFEWGSAPLMAFTQSDWWVFIFNTVSLVLLPGLVFSVFTRLGVRPRVAWHWMWVAPAGYCFLFQAGSIGNDLFGAVFALAAVDFALRARRSGAPGAVMLSILSAALLTSSKASNIPLLLPWVLAFASSWRVWLLRPMTLALVLVPAAGASFLPTAILNYKNCGDWTGMTAEAVNIGNGPAWLHVLNNTIMMCLENLVPPVFPMAAAWTRFADTLIPPALAAQLQQHFESGAAHWQLGEMQLEERAGIGFGVTTLLVASVLAAILWRKRSGGIPIKPVPLLVRLLHLSPWVALLYAFSKLGLTGVSRYMTPYFLLLLPVFLVGGAHAELVRRKWWRVWAYVGFGLAALPLVLSPARPLWPAEWMVSRYAAQLQTSRLGTRILTVYQVYGQRANAFEPIVKQLPADASPLGFITFDDPETSLWQPFGSRRILHVLPRDTAAEVRARGIKYVLVKAERLREPVEEWLRRMNARLLLTTELRLRAGRKSFVWHLTELNPAPGSEANAESHTVERQTSPPQSK